MQTLSHINAITNAAAAIFPVICPACRREGNFQPVGQDLGLQIAGVSPQGGARFLNAGHRQCPNASCKTHVFVVYESVSPNRVLSVYPAGRIDFNTEGVPDRVRKAFDEALTCEANGCYTAAGMLIRKTLEAVCEERAAQGDSLKARISALKDKVTLPAALFEAMDHLRLLGNDAAHVQAEMYDEIGEAEIAVAAELTKEIIKATYQYKGLLGRLQGLQKKPAT